jgi:hypothetical protein
MIKRSVPNTFLVRCPTLDYANGVAMGVHEALNCLTHECDIIMRTDTEISEIPKEHPEHDQEYSVRARFTVREKQKGVSRGQIIKINKAYYEEKIDDSLNFERQLEPTKIMIIPEMLKQAGYVKKEEWKGLSDTEKLYFLKFLSNQPIWKIIETVETELKEKNNV